METKYSILELLLVSAEGLKHAHHLGLYSSPYLVSETLMLMTSDFAHWHGMLFAGTQRHYVNIQFGDQIFTSKITQGKGKKVWWNEKFRFPLSSDECKELAKVTLKIMERDKFSEDSLVGETKVHVGDIISEGIEREFLQMKPAPYNVVLEDGRYKGELKLGLKFLPNVSLESLEQCTVPPRRQTSVPYRPFLNITLPDIPWRRLFFFCTRSNAKGSRKTKNS
uniref:C2 domain-containing protein n=2 Tax=Oryza TaxID=4527 RepID=A0A0E0NIW6_ORYRU